MSIRTMTRVWDTSRQSGSKLLLLLAIADHADDDGFAWPGIDRLASKTRLSGRHVTRMAHDLAATGELYLEDRGRQGKCNQYIVLLGLNDADLAHVLRTKLRKSATEIAAILKRRGDNLSGVTTCQGGVTTCQGGDDTTTSPESSRDPSSSLEEGGKEGPPTRGQRPERPNPPPDAPTLLTSLPQPPAGRAPLAAPIAELWAQACPTPRRQDAQRLLQFATTYGAHWVGEAIGSMSGSGPIFKLKAVEVTLERWQREDSWGSPAPGLRPSRGTSAPRAARPTKPSLADDDPRRAHSVVVAYVTRLARVPDANQADRMIVEVQDQARWEATLTDWHLNGHLAHNVAGLLDNYRKRRPSTSNDGDGQPITRDQLVWLTKQRRATRDEVLETQFNRILHRRAFTAAEYEQCVAAGMPPRPTAA